MCLFYSNGKQALCVCVWGGGMRGECLATQTLIKVTLALIFEKQKLTSVEKEWGCREAMGITRLMGRSGSQTKI